MKRAWVWGQMRTHADRVIAATFLVSAAALYIRTACPTLGGGVDSEEYQHVAYTLSIAHSTGYPLYLLLGKVFTSVVPLGNIAYRMNLLSALLGAGAVAFVYLNAMQLTHRRIASLVATALFATNESVWRQAGVASISPLHLLLLSGLVLALLLWYSRRVPLALAAFMFGLGLANHRSVLILAPIIVLFVLLRMDSNVLTAGAKILRRQRDLARILFWSTLPLLLYLYIPLRGSETPWYTNSLQSFIGEVSGSEAGNYFHDISLTLAQSAVLAQYLFRSFGYLGLLLIVVGGVSVLRRWNHWQAPLDALPVPLFLSLSALAFAGFAVSYESEPDRLLVMPFFFLVYWFAIGAGATESLIESKLRATRWRSTAQFSFAAALGLLVILPFGDRYRIADWSEYTRVYQQWDEIFTLPIPRGAVLVGNWGQLNAMRYMQRVENRRPDLQFVGTLYDPAPQTEAAVAALADGRAFYLSPGIAQPVGTYRYEQLGPLLEVRGSPQTQPPAVQKNIVVNSSLALADFSLSTALEPYAPTSAIAPGRTVRVALDWRADGRVKDFLVRLLLYDPEARLVAQKDEPPVRDLYPVAEWQRGEYVSDVHNFLVPPGAPPGEYQINLQLLDAETKASMGKEISLASAKIVRATNLTRAQVFVQRPLDVILEPRVALWGIGGLEGTYHAGDTLSINWVWYAREDVGEDLAARLALVDSSGRPVSEWQRAPIAFYSTREWRKGEILKGYVNLLLSGGLPPGDYALTAGIGGGSETIGKIQIAP